MVQPRRNSHLPEGWRRPRRYAYLKPLDPAKTKRELEEELGGKLKRELDTPAISGVSSALNYCQLLLTLQRAAIGKIRTEFGNVEGIIRVAGQSAKGEPTLTEIVEQMKPHTREAVERELHAKFARFSLAGTKEGQLLNEELPRMRKVLMTAELEKNEKNLYRLLLNVFYVGGTIHQPTIEKQPKYMTKTMWKIFDYLQKKTREIEGRK